MSTTIDERVVEMRFDNKQFESNVSTSMSTLKKLKESLKFTGATKGLEEIDAASKRVNMSGLGGAVDSVKAKFSAMDVVAVTALANITNSAINTGKRLVASLSVDQISAGWKKFGDKTTSVATLVAQGNAIEDVNKQLGLLNWFTDETSYNFTDMVANIAKFTASGKGLEESVTAMEGIATRAALSGQNAMTASRAMYQLSQAMGAGVMRREDYRSIQNASMDTEEFRQKCLDAAVALGTLKDNGDGTYTSIVEGAKESTFTISQFADNLTEGMWLTSDVMMSVYKNYASAVNAIYEAVEEKGFDNASQVLTEIHNKADELKTGAMTDAEAIDAAIKELGYTLEDGSLKFDHFGVKAFEAAQQARTFTDVIDSVKDAVSTGWMNTFELIFGDANKATELWTMMANELWTTFAGGSERRNSILDSAMVSGWDKLVERIKDAGIETDAFETKVRECAKAGGADVDGLIKEYGSLSDVFKNGALDTDYLKKALDSLTGSITEATTGLSVDLSDILPGKYGETMIAWGSDATESIKKIQTALTELGYDLSKYGANGIFKDETWAAVAAFQKDAGLKVTGQVDQATLDALAEAGKSLQTISENAEGASVEIDDLLDSLSRPSGRELIFDIIKNSLQVVNGILGAFREAWAGVFSEEEVASGIYGILKSIRDFTEGLFTLDKDGNRVIKNFDKIKSTLQGVISVFDILASIVGGAVKFAFKALDVVFGGFNLDILGATSNIGEFLTGLAKTIKEGEYIGKAFDWLLEKFKAGVQWIKEWISNLLAPIKEIPFVKEVISAFKGLSVAFNKFKAGESSIAELGIAIKNTALRILNAIPAFQKWFATFKESETFKKWVAAFTEFQTVVQKFKTGEIGFGELLSGLGDFISKALMSIPIIEKWVTAVQNWYAAFKETPAVKQLVSAINSISEAFNKLKNGDLSFEDFGTILGENLGKAISALPEVIKGAAKGVVDGAKQIASDFIQGFQNGIVEKVSGVISSIVGFCTNFVASFKEALGIHSPSWIAHEAGTNFLQGFIDGVKEKLGNVIGVLKTIGEKIVKVFKSFWNFITDESGNIEWGKIFAGGIVGGMVFAVIKIANAIGRISKAFIGIGDLITSAKGVLDNFGLVLKSFGKVLNSVAFDFKAKALLKIAAAIAILAASVWLLAQIPSDKKDMMWNAVGVILALAVIMGVLAFAMSKMSTASVDLEKRSAELKGVNTVILQIAIAMLALVAAVKILGGLEPEEAKQGFMGLAGIAIGLLAFLAIVGLISKYSGEADNLGSMMLKISVGLAVMALVMKMISKMEPGDILIGVIVLEAFVLFILQLSVANRIAGQNGGAFANNIIKISASMLVLVLLLKTISKMDPADIIIGIVAIQALVILIGEMALINRLAGGGGSKFGGAVMNMATSIMILTGVIWMLSKMNPADVDNGIKVMQKFILLVAELTLISRLAGKDTANISANILAMSAAIGILAGIAILLSFVDVQNLAKGIIAVGMLGSIMALMIWACRGVQDVKGNLIAMVVAIGLMAAAVVALSLIKDTTRLAASVTAMSILMSVFAVAIKAISGLEITKSTLTSLGVMTGVVLVLAGLVFLMSAIPNPDIALKNTVAISSLMLALTASLFVVAKAGKISKTVSNQLLPMLGVAAGLAIILGVMSALDVEASITSAVAIGILMNAMASSMYIMAKAGKMSKTVSNQLFPMLAVVAGLSVILGIMSALNVEASIPTAIALGILLNALASSIVVLGLAGPRVAKAVPAAMLMGVVLAEIALVFGLLKLMDVEPSIETALSLSALLLALSAACLIVSKVPSATAIDGALGLAAFIGIMAAVVAAAGLLSKIPGFNDILADGGESLRLIGTAIGNFVGGIAGGIISGAGSAIISLLPQLGEALSGFMTGAQPFIDATGNVDSSVISGAACLSAAILLLTGANFISGVTSILTLGQSSFAMLGVQLKLFGEGAKEFSDSISGVDASSVEAAKNIADMILALTASDFLSGITSLFGGGTDFGSFGLQLKTFGEAVVGFSETISGKIDVAAVEAATKAGELLVALNKSLPRSGGWVQVIIGEKDFGKFASACNAFAKCILGINNTLSQNGFEIQSEKLEQLAKAGTQFSELNKSLPRTGGVAQDLAGEQDLSKFGSACAAFARCMIAISNVLSQDGLEIKSDKLKKLAKAGTQFSDLNNALPRTGGVAQDLAGEQDLSKFGTACAAFAACMVAVNAAVSQEGFSVNLEAIESLKQAGLKMEELQEVLPKSGGLWQEIAGSSDIGDFGTKISTFATAIVDFSSKATGLDTSAIDLAILTAYRIKTLLGTLVGIDYSGVAEFTGVGTGGSGADGPMYKFGEAISKFSSSLDGINTENINVAVNAATRLRDLISGLAGLDTSGVELFKPSEIGKQIKEYSDKVSEIDAETVSSSITSASRLKALITGLVGLDTSGIASFTPGPIATAIKDYSDKISEVDAGGLGTSITVANRLKSLIASLSGLDNSGIARFTPGTIGDNLNKYGVSVTGLNVSAIVTSINSANRIKDFISSLAGLNTSGVSAFKNAINELSSISTGGLATAFAGITPQMIQVGMQIATSISSGITEGGPTVSESVTLVVTTVLNAVRLKTAEFRTVGRLLIANLSNGMNSAKSSAKSKASSVASYAANGARAAYQSMYGNGSYIIDGLKKGIEDNKYKVFDAVEKLAEELSTKFRITVLIGSPSKLFAEYGKFIDEGLAIGVRDNAGIPVSAVEGMANNALRTMQDAISNASDMFNIDANLQPTIRPVVDLSDVQTGVDAINSIMLSDKNVGVMANFRAISSSMNARSQNRSNDDIISAINKLGAGLENNRGDTYNFGDFTYDDGSEIADAVGTLIRYAKVGRRV